MNRLFRYLDIALNELYKEDLELLKDQSLNSIVFRLGIYLNNLLKNDLYYNHLDVDYNFKDDSKDYLDLVIHNRNTKNNLLVIKVLKDVLEIKSNINKIKLITESAEDNIINYGVLVTLNNKYYNTYKLSPKYYDVDLLI